MKKCKARIVVKHFCFRKVEEKEERKRKNYPFPFCQQIWIIKEWNNSGSAHWYIGGLNCNWDNKKRSSRFKLTMRIILTRCYLLSNNSTHTKLTNLTKPKAEWQLQNYKKNNLVWSNNTLSQCDCCAMSFKQGQWFFAGAKPVDFMQLIQRSFTIKVKSQEMFSFYNLR